MQLSTVRACSRRRLAPSPFGRTAQRRSQSQSQAFTSVARSAGRSGSRRRRAWEGVLQSVSASLRFDGAPRRSEGRRAATGGRERAGRTWRRARVEHAACDTPQAAWSLQRATHNVQLATCNVNRRVQRSAPEAPARHARYTCCRFRSTPHERCGLGRGGQRWADVGRSWADVGRSWAGRSRAAMARTPSVLGPRRAPTPRCRPSPPPAPPHSSEAVAPSRVAVSPAGRRRPMRAACAAG
jgi:hypothetical protein